MGVSKTFIDSLFIFYYRYDGELIKQLALVSEQLADKFNRDF